MVTKAQRKKLVKDFEFRLDLAKARALSKVSLKRPLTDRELKDFRKSVKKLKKVVE